MKCLFKSGLFGLLISLCFFSQAFASDIALSFRSVSGQDGWTESTTQVGSVGQGKALYAFSINLPPEVSGISYKSYLSDVGWQDAVIQGQTSGSEDLSHQIEAVDISLTDSMVENYDLYYRVHVSTIGWLDWTKGGPAGTKDMGLPVEAVEVEIVAKGSEFAGPIGGSYIDVSNIDHEITYNTHVQDYGWTNEVSGGNISGTVGEGKRVEALTISAPSVKKLDATSEIVYDTHVQNIGWTSEVHDGEISGTTGEGLQVEALKIDITGRAQDFEDVYYRVHVANYGWLDWAKNGEVAGTEGLNLRVEAVEIVLQDEDTPAPGDTDRPNRIRSELESDIDFSGQAAVQNLGWLDPVTSNGSVIGTEGKGVGLEALTMELPNMPDSGISYNLMIEDIGWQGERSDGELAGTTGENKQAETIQIRLTGEAAYDYDIYYQAHVEDYGWLGWTKNNEWAGTTDGNRMLEAVRVKLVVKGDPAPGSTENSYFVAERKTTELKANEIPNFDLICAIVQHEGGASYEGALAVMSCVMNRVDSGRWGGSDPVSVLTAPGQFSSYLDGYYKQFLGRTSLEVQRAVLDCLNGKRSHPYQSFRSYPTSGSIQIGGNYFF